MFTNSTTQRQSFVCCLFNDAVGIQNYSSLGSVNGKITGEWSTGNELEVVVA
jgi:hypothetical protein